MSDLLRIIYASRPFGYDSAMLNGILVDARRCNLRDGVTGALVCRQDIYIQYLEGPRKALEATYARIRRDDRHLEITTHVKEPVGDRMFGDWAMHHDPAQSWIWTRSEISEGASDRATPDDFRRLFGSLGARIARDCRG